MENEPIPETKLNHGKTIAWGKEPTSIAINRLPRNITSSNLWDRSNNAFILVNPGGYTFRCKLNYQVVGQNCDMLVGLRFIVQDNNQRIYYYGEELKMHSGSVQYDTITNTETLN